MKSTIKTLMAITVLLLSLNSFGQIKNPQTKTVRISGNCEKCKNTIENAGTEKNVAAIVWNKDSKIASLTYDSKKTSPDETLKLVALAGYDSENFLAPDDVYEGLPDCCKYIRSLKPTSTDKSTSEAHRGDNSQETIQSSTSTLKSSELKNVFDQYFSLKDALVNTDKEYAMAKAAELLKIIKAVDTRKLSAKELSIWMSVAPEVTLLSEKIATSKNIVNQRETFAALSPYIYDLVKVSSFGMPVYYHYCPMYDNGKGANWLSKEVGVKNPYYGSQMLTCGKTVETIE